MASALGVSAKAFIAHGNQFAGAVSSLDLPCTGNAVSIRTGSTISSLGCRVRPSSSRSISTLWINRGSARRVLVRRTSQHIVNEIPPQRNSSRECRDEYGRPERAHPVRRRQDGEHPHVRQTGAGLRRLADLRRRSRETGRSSSVFLRPRPLTRRRPLASRRRGRSAVGRRRAGAVAMHRTYLAQADDHLRSESRASGKSVALTTLDCAILR